MSDTVNSVITQCCQCSDTVNFAVTQSCQCQTLLIFNSTAIILFKRMLRFQLILNKNFKYNM